MIGNLPMASCNTGTLRYLVASVAGSSLESAARAMLPYLIVLVLAVILIAFVPQITLAVPQMLGR